jgi:hypothetical protein
MFRRRRFREVIERQLAFFEEDDFDLLTDVDRALEKYERADRDEAEELYGDYQLTIEAATDGSPSCATRTRARSTKTTPSNSCASSTTRSSSVGATSR